jgi:cytochrome c oxidase cbb3-type subunit I
VVSVAFYGMSTFEGPVMSIKAVNALSHYTDWTIGHVHSGALGWVGFISFGALYYLVPRCGTARGSIPAPGLLALLDRDHRHRALHHRDVGLRHHAGPDVARLRQLGFLQYSFIETVEAMHPYYVIRAARRRPVPDRRADHGLQPVATVRGDEPERTAGSFRPARRPPSAAE